MRSQQDQALMAQASGHVPQAWVLDVYVQEEDQRVLLKALCPFCGNLHSHGGRADLMDSELADRDRLRASHCWYPQVSGIYLLRLPAQDPRELMRLAFDGRCRNLRDGVRCTSMVSPVRGRAFCEVHEALRRRHNCSAAMTGWERFELGEHG